MSIPELGKRLEAWSRRAFSRTESNANIGIQLEYAGTPTDSPRMAASEQKLALELEAMYGDLKRLARGQLRRERDDHTLSATGLVHEAYLKLASSNVDWQDKNHFLGIAARAMRQILVNHALAHRTEKRGGDWLRLTLTSATPEIEAQQDDVHEIVGLDEALKQLEALDERQGRIVELRYFGGLSIEETAQALNLSPATVKREWAVAKLFLRRVMADGAYKGAAH